MPDRTLSVPIAVVACFAVCACTPSAVSDPSPSASGTSVSASPSPSASASKSASQVAAEDTTVKAYTVLWSFIALETPTRDIESEFAPYMRNVRNNGTEGWVCQELCVWESA